MSRVAITSLAILKVNWDVSHKDYIENFVPLVAEAIRLNPAPVISLTEVQASMLKHFGLRVPLNSLRIILTRLVKKGLLRSEQKSFVPNATELAKLTVETVRNRVVAQHEAVINALRQHVEKTFAVKWDVEDAEDALLLYMRERDLQIVVHSSDGSPIPPVGRSVRNSRFLVNSFIRCMSETNSEVFGYVETIAKGNMLANVLIFPNLSEVQRNFRRTQVFLDTRPILNALGLCGPYYQAPIQDLLDLLYESGAEAFCFRHTYEEVYGILDACSKSFQKDHHLDVSGDVAQHFLGQGATASDIALEMTRVQRKLPALHIRVVDKPPYDPQHQVNELLLEETIQKHLPFHKDAPRRRDVDSLSAIYRLRRGQEFYALEECPAIFITTNSALALASNEFFQAYQSPHSIRICMTDHHITNILWLKKPMTLPDLPRKQVIADCYAALAPNDELWRKYLAEISKLQARGDISDEDYYLLRSELDAKSQLMDIAQGDADAFLEGTVYQILEKVKHNIKADALAKLDVEKVKTGALEKQLQERDSKIDGASRRVGKFLAYALATLVAILLILGMYESSPFAATSPTSRLLRAVLFLSGLFAVVAAFVNLLTGTALKDLLRIWEVHLTWKTKNILRKFLT